MQDLAEKAVSKHMKNLQKEFFIQQKIPEKENPTAPFLNLTEGEIDTLLLISLWRSERLSKMIITGIDVSFIL